MNRRILWAALGVLVGLAMWGNPSGAAEKGASAPVRLQLKNYDELMQLVAAKRGKVVVVDVWSTFCEPCMREFPGLVGLHKKYGPEKVACMSLCVNFTGLGKPEDEVEEPLKFLESKGAVFDNILSTEGDEVLYKKLGIGSVPAILIFGPDGKRVKTFSEAKYADVEAYIAPLIAAQ